MHWEKWKKTWSVEQLTAGDFIEFTVPEDDRIITLAKDLRLYIGKEVEGMVHPGQNWGVKPKKVCVGVRVGGGGRAVMVKDFYVQSKQIIRVNFSPGHSLWSY